MTQDPAPYPDKRARAATIRSKVMLEVASELAGLDTWDFKQARVDMRRQGAESWAVSLFGSDGLDGVKDLVECRSHFAILNPATALLRASQTAGGDVSDLRSIATIPSYDQLGFAVAKSFGLTSLEELSVAKPPVTLSLRGDRPHHAVHMVALDTLLTVGVTLENIADWGGSVRYDTGIPHQSPRLDSMQDGSVSAVFDEGIYNWVDLAIDSGFTFLSIGDQTSERLNHLGYRRGTISSNRYERLDTDVATVDFSGFAIVTRADVQDSIVAAFCEAMVARASTIPWQGGDTLPLARMCIDAIDAPLAAPLHDAAASVWYHHGYLEVGEVT